MMNGERFTSKHSQMKFHQQKPAVRAGGSRKGLRRKKGAATLDYVLVMGVILPLAAFLMLVVPRMIKLVYELIVVTVNSPMM